MLQKPTLALFYDTVQLSLRGYFADLFRIICIAFITHTRVFIGLWVTLNVVFYVAFFPQRDRVWPFSFQRGVCWTSCAQRRMASWGVRCHPGLNACTYICRRWNLQRRSHQCWQSDLTRRAPLSALSDPVMGSSEKVWYIYIFFYGYF